jgi:DNA-binding transcriptional LysR family regulator
MMISISPSDSADIQFRKLGHLHFIPIVSKSYIAQYGLPTRSNLQHHFFIQSEYYLARTGLWDGWLQAVSRGRIAHHCDNSFAYGMLVKAGLGIGMLGSYAAIEPAAVPVELGLRVSVPLYAIALTERLHARPVRAVFDWLCDIFGPQNPWFAEDFRLDHAPSAYDSGFRMLFNIESENS